MKCSIRRLLTVLACIGAGWSTPLSAAPEEIQVYDDELTAPGQYGMDLHLNDALVGHREADYPGARPSDRVVRATPEFYRGLTDRLELGVYVLTAVSADGHPAVDGLKARIKYIAPHEEQGGYWGLNVEVGKTTLAVAPQAWNYEIKGIAGWRAGPWRLAANLNIDAALSGQAGPATMELTSRIGREVGHDVVLGLEAYDTLGTLSHPGSLDAFEHTLFVTADVPASGVDVHLGIGRGLTGVADPWVVKAILGFKFGSAP
jgi:hypothetical protein